jgi:hypothetical protein
MSASGSGSGPDRQLRERILGAIAREPSPTRRQRRGRSARLFAAAGAVALLIFLVYGGVRVQGRPLSLVAGTVSGSALLAAAGLTLALSRGRSMLGRRPAWLLGAAAVLPLLFLGWKVGLSALYEGMSGAWPERPGFKCLALALLTGLPPLGAALALHRRTHPSHPGAAGAAMGAAFGLAGAVLVDLWCPVAHLPHLLLGHLLPVAVLAVAGGLAGARLLAPRFQGSERPVLAPVP